MSRKPGSSNRNSSRRNSGRRPKSNAGGRRRSSQNRQRRHSRNRSPALVAQKPENRVSSIWSIFCRKEKQELLSMTELQPMDAGESFPALYSYYPELVETLPWISLRGDEQEAPPRQLHRSQHLWGGHHFYLKEDSLNLDLVVGSEARRLEFVMGQLKKRHPKRLVVFDEVNSTRPLAWAQACSRFGLKIEVHLYGKAENRPLGARAEDYGARVKVYSSLRSFRWAEKWNRQVSKWRSSVVVPSAELKVLESIGYMDAIMELHAQVRAGLIPDFHVLLLPVRSGSAYLGLEIGRRLLGWDNLKVIGLRKETDPMSLSELLTRAAEIKSLLTASGLKKDFPLPQSADELQVFELDASKVDSQFKIRLSRRLLELEAWEMDLKTEADLLAGALSWLNSTPQIGLNVLFWSFSSEARRPVRIPSKESLPEGVLKKTAFKGPRRRRR